MPRTPCAKGPQESRREPPDEAPSHRKRGSATGASSLKAAQGPGHTERQLRSAAGQGQRFDRSSARRRINEETMRNRKLLFIVGSKSEKKP